MLDVLRSAKRAIVGRLDGERSLRRRYAKIHGGELDLANAKTFTQKLYRQMIEFHRARTPLYTMLVDKYEVREYVSKKIGKEHLIPLVWVGEKPETIPFDMLPERCIAKATHGSGLNLILRAPVDQGHVISMFRKWLSENHYWRLREAHYFDVKPRIVVEEFIDDGNDDGPLDYRFWCFGGKAAAIQVDNSTHTICPFYTPDWDLTGATYRSREMSKPVPKPENLAGMVEIAENLSSPFGFVRLDLYNIKGHIYFGEFTFTPTAELNKFDPPEWDSRFGELWP